MQIMIINSNVNSVRMFGEYAKNTKEIEIVGTFLEGSGAVDFVKEHRVDLAVIDIRVQGMGGAYLGRLLKSVCPEMALIFTTGYEEDLLEMTGFQPAAYLLEPYTKEEFDYSIHTVQMLYTEGVRHSRRVNRFYDIQMSVPESRISRKKKHEVFIRTFGHFDVFVDNRPIMFRSGKAKELLALLVDREGGTVNTEQIICALWEDRPNDEATQNLCCKTARALKGELRENGIEELLVVNRSMKRVDTECFTCDLYELLAEDERAKKQFVGDYLLEYSWAEERMASLSKYL